MKSRPWELGEHRLWVCADARDAWSALLNGAASKKKTWEDAQAFTRRGSANNDQWLIAAGALDPAFAELCRTSVEELEAARSIAPRLSYIWCLLTAAVLWHETPLERQPRNAPTKLP